MILLGARSNLRAFLFTLLGLSTAAVAAAEPGVLIAIDSSRSLSAEQSRAAAALAKELVARLAPATSVAVLTFDDSVHWLARPGEDGGEAALDALTPAGRYTVLNDGLIEGVRALADGGVLVVISDGKDENSATTIEDVTRLASERHVRVVALGAGNVDERTMRRLALLTEGRYAGATAGIDPGALSDEVEVLRRQVAVETAPPPAEPPPTAVAAAPEVPAPEVAPTRDGSRLLLLVGALVAAAGIVVGFLLARRRPPAEPVPGYEPDSGTQPGVAMPEPPRASAPTPAPVPEVAPLDEIRLARLRGRPAIPPNGLLEISLDDTAAFQRLPFSESIERTLVITEEVVLKVREPGQDPRTYRVPPGRAIDVGRDSKRNTLGFHDPTMSVQHFRLALDEGEVFLLDLGSTNGVLYRERRVQSALVEPGERFRAGMIEFELVLHRVSAG